MEQEQGKKVMFRQGDVLVVLDPISALPEGAKEVPPTERGVVLAYGEVTGHAHAVPLKTTEGGEPNVRYFDWNAERFLQVIEKTALKHEEHNPIVLEPGIYRQAFQTEDYGTERRAVED